MPDEIETSQSGHKVPLVVDLPGLVEIFGDSLYDDFRAVVRELVQNSHDGIMEKISAGETVGTFSSANRIDVSYNLHDNLLSIADSGQGMTIEELAANLNNFARSRKRSLQAQINDSATTDHLQLIGEYGVGFLAAMAASDSVEVLSKKAGSEVCQWTYRKGEQTASLSSPSESVLTSYKQRLQLPTTSTGTVVVCRLSANVIEQYHVDEHTIRESLVHYTQILPIPLYFNGELISCTVQAWAEPALATPQDWTNAIESMKGEHPLLVIPIYSPPGDLDLQGALWIPQRSALHGDAYLDVYVKRMYVLSDESILFPEWARFLLGFLNSNKLKRIVSGTTIKNDKQSVEVKAFLKAAIIDSFKGLRSRSEEEYWKIIGPHDDTIKESAVDSDEFMECVWDKIRVKVRSRTMTIPDYLSAVERRTGRRDVAYYFENQMQEFAANLVADSTGVPVMCLCGRANELFVRRVCQKESIELLSFRALADDHFHLADNPTEMECLIAACAESNVAAEIRTYEPIHVPAVLIEDKTVLERREDLLRGLRVHGEKRFVEDLEKLFNAKQAANSGVAFYLNSSNNLIQALTKAPYDTQVAVCLALYNISFMAAMPELKKAEVQSIYNSISSVLMRLLKTSGEVATRNTPGLTSPDNALDNRRTRPIRVFMITPFAKEYANVVAAVRRVFEDSPYFFEVALAKDYMLESKLLESMRAHMRMADAFIADITNLNPNVMLELGAVLINTDGRPVFALRGQSACGDVPADIRSELYIPYGEPTDEPAVIAARIREAIERNGKPAHKEIVGLVDRRPRRALTRYLLENLRYRLDQSEIAAIVKMFDTIEDLISAPKEEVARKLGMREREVSFIQDEINLRASIELEK